MPITVPKHLLLGLAEVDQSEIELWWSSLPDETKEQVTMLCDQRQASCFFGVTGKSDAPKLEGGHFLPESDNVNDDGQLWDQDRFEYLMNHPELVVVWDTETRKVHIGCIAHINAQKCWRNGVVPHDFDCPFEHDDCLMSPLRGRSITFRPQVTNLQNNT